MTRLFDLCFAFFGLVLLSPVLLLWVMGWFNNRSPLFRQERVVRLSDYLRTDCGAD